MQVKSIAECSKNSNSKRRPIIGYHDRLLLNAGQKYCRMLQEHSAILSTFIKLLFVFKTFVLSIFEWPLKTGFTVDILTIYSFFFSRRTDLRWSMDEEGSL